jgi:uncharacterized protein
VSVIPLYELQQPFYVPSFEVLLKRGPNDKGEPMPPAVARDVIEVTYQDSIDKVDSFTLVINNWDAMARQPKFLGGSSEDKKNFELVQPGNEVQLLMGYQGRTPDLRVMTTGYITTLEADFPEAGAPRLTVRGLNVLDRFRGKQFTWAWPADPKATVRDSDIAKELSGTPDSPPGKPGLGIEVRPNQEAAGTEVAVPYVMMLNEYPILFLMRRARLHGYEVFLAADAPAKPDAPPKPYLYFGPSNRLADRTYQLEWGKSLVSFKPTISTARQVKKVTVLGWDRVAKKEIKAEATLADLPNVNADLHALAEANGREEVVTDHTVTTENEAKKMAKDLLRAQLLDMVEATGVVVGLPDLRAGRQVDLQGFDPRLNGRWFVKETTHVINDSGYRTTFVARREREQGT